MDVAGLNVVLSISGVGAVTSGLNQINSQIMVVNNNITRVAAPVKVVEESFSDLAGTMLGALGTIGALVGGFSLLGEVAGAVSGVEIAAEYGQIQAQLEAVTGSSTKAAAALQAFSDIGLKTKFDTQQVASFGARLLAQTGNVAETKRDIAAILDVSAAGGVSRAMGSRFMEDIMKIRGQANPNLRDIRALMRAGPGIGRILGAATGKGTMDEGQINTLAKSMGGAKFFDLLVQAGQGAGVKGASEKLGPIDFMGNLMENLNRIMLPTGRILLALLMPLGQFVMWLSQLLGTINQLTGGGAGLTVIMLAVVRGWSSIVVGIRVAIGALTELSMTLNKLAGSAKLASVTSGGGGLASGLGVVGGVAKFLSENAGTIAGVGLGALGGAIGGGAGEAMQAAGIGASIGGMIGSIIPGVGNLIGAGVGGLLGGVGDLAYRAFKPEKEDAAAAQTKALQENTEAIKTLHTHLVGGGPRTRNAANGLEVEFALANIIGGPAG